MSRRQTIGKVARRAAAFIEENGWRQGDWLGADGSVCLRGAFNVVTVGHIANSPGLAELEFAKWLGKFEDLLQDSSPNAGSNLINLAPWNDAKGSHPGGGPGIPPQVR